MGVLKDKDDWKDKISAKKQLKVKFLDVPERIKTTNGVFGGYRRLQKIKSLQTSNSNF